MTYTNTELAHEFRKAREWQKSLWAKGGMLTVDPSGRTELTFASAAFGEHAISAFMSAKRAVHFRATLSADVKSYKKRSAAAKKAWKARKAA